MKTYTISKLARAFDLSRSTLLYYDRIGLLPPSGRTSSGYRCYNEKDYKRLERICTFRRAGVALKHIQVLILAESHNYVKVLENRLKEIETEIRSLKDQQGLISRMLKGLTQNSQKNKLDKKLWVSMFRTAGMDNDAMDAWHAEFEARAPEEHHDFLVSLGIPEKEILQIRQFAAKLNSDSI